MSNRDRTSDRVRLPRMPFSAGGAAASSRGQEPAPGRLDDTAVITLPHGPALNGFKRRQEENERIAARLKAKARRVHQRVEVRLDVMVVYKFVDREGAADLDRIYQGRMRDISRGGTLFCGTLHPTLTPDSLLTGQYLVGMNLCLPFVERPVKILGEAVRVQPSPQEPAEYLFGVKFLDIADEAEVAINNFLISFQLSGRKRV